MTYLDGPCTLTLDPTQPLAMATSTYMLLTVLWRQGPPQALARWTAWGGTVARVMGHTN